MFFVQNNAGEVGLHVFFYFGREIFPVYACRIVFWTTLDFGLQVCGGFVNTCLYTGFVFFVEISFFANTVMVFFTARVCVMHSVKEHFYAYNLSVGVYIGKESVYSMRGCIEFLVASIEFKQGSSACYCEFMRFFDSLIKLCSLCPLRSELIVCPDAAEINAVCKKHIVKSCRYARQHSLRYKSALAVMETVYPPVIARQTPVKVYSIERVIILGG